MAEGAAYCTTCGQRIEGTEQPQPAEPFDSHSLAARRRPLVYAGFWLRVVAYLLDTLVLGFLLGITILRPLMERAGISRENPWELITGTSRQVLAINLLVTMAAWIYWASLESSRWQATLGKKMLGLVVTDLGGHRISFARASGRFFGKFLSSLTLGIGYVMAGFTPNKQALHDRIARCLVLKKI